MKGEKQGGDASSYAEASAFAPRVTAGQAGGHGPDGS